jgi:NADH-quinone oxidoreductase subunit A
MAVYFAGVLGAVGFMVGASWLLGQRHNERATGDPYEGGIPQIGSARLRFPAKFYLVAMAFVIFDLEAIFVLAWGASFRQTGWTGYAGLLIFLTILVASLIYEWKLGALDWSSSSRKQKKYL